MDCLPQELIEAIADYLCPYTSLPEDEDEDGWDPYVEPQKLDGSLAPYAMISRAWQAAIERRTFRSLKFESEETSVFRARLTPSRYGYIQRIIFTCILPSYDSESASKIETRQDRDANNQAYSKAIHEIFSILKSMDDSGDRNLNLELFINHPKSYSDVPYSAGRGMKGPEGQIYEGRYYHSYIDLYNVHELPPLQHVAKLVMRMPKDQLGHRMIYPRIPFQMAAKMPNLEVLNVDANDNERLYISRRREIRQELAEQLQTLTLPKLKKADLHFLYISPEDHRYMPPMLNPTADFDLLSSACQSFSQGLEELDLNGVLDATLLRPLQTFKTALWPNLRQLDIHFHQVRPAGQWYFKGDPPSWMADTLPASSGDIESVGEEFDVDREMGLIGMQTPCYFRSTPDDEAITPFVEAFADAVALMPKIRNAMLHSTLVEGNAIPEWFVIAYVAPCRQPEVCLGKCYRLPNRNLVTDLQGWTPTERVANKLRSIGSNFHDGGLTEESMEKFLSRHGQL